ncbi:MAG: penicillin acylase family protein [Acidobacteriaceae bacterium]|nr:penicillin acylase family protein [Acidobacteriaceae bacterium]MBV9779024.1 penicillin acylase family protein [Acidobacteriaceae bacterium]
MPSRLVRIVNVCIAVFMLFVVIAVYRYAIRPLPQTSGEMTAPVRAPATIKRDVRGVPHIEASSWQDAIFLQGYVTAQDRLWQMDGLRRFSAGELAEVFGPRMLANDERSRRMRIKAVAEAHAKHLSASEQSVLTEYARGVNYFIDTHRGDYSLEFSIPGNSYNPRAWSITDSILVGLAMFRDLTDGSRFELAKGTLAGMADPAKMKVLFPPVQGGYVNPGSNAWAVSGAHTASGKPILANDPHLAYSIPGPWHLVHLKAPGLNVAGAALPGVPCIITGHNDQIAWGVTNLETDVLDLYAEQMDQRNGHYLFREKLEQAELDREMVGVKGGNSVNVDVWVTRHGPIVDERNGKAYAMRWDAMDGFGFPFFDIDRAENWEEFRSALSHYWGPAQNFVYADKAGHIGYQAAGRVPVRRGFDGDMPLDGASGSYEWDAYVPFDQMPSQYDPPSGIIATANQNPFAPEFAFRVDGNFSDRYRVQQIRNLLARKSRLDVEDMLTIQKDVYSEYDYLLAQQVIAAFTKRGSKEEIAHQAIDVLRNWNGQMEKDQAAPMITELLSRGLGEALVISIVLPRPIKGIPNIRPRPQIIEQLLRDRPTGWISKDNWDGWLLDNFVHALNAGRREQGMPVSRWRWGGMLRWKIEHPVGGRLPFIDRFFNIGPVEMSGSGTSVKQTTAVIGPSERMVVDLGNLENSVQNLMAGESGFVASAHYKDQWDAYYAGKSFPMQFERIDAKDVLRVRPER